MPLHLVQLTDKEWTDWQTVVGVAHLLSVNLKAGSYKGAIGNNDAGKALRADLTALINASDKVVEFDDIRPAPSDRQAASAVEMTDKENRDVARRRGNGKAAAKTPAPVAATTESETESSPETNDEPDTDPRDEEEDTGG